MKKLHTYNIVASIPEELKELKDLVYNLWWCWTPSATQLFMQFDRNLFNQSKNNPIKMFGLSAKEKFEQFLRMLK